MIEPNTIWDAHCISPHKEYSLQSWARIDSLTRNGHVALNGSALDIATVMAVAREGCIAKVSSNPEVARKVNASIETLNDCLDQGHSIYGINTGFGGSADTRTHDAARLQQSLLQLTQSGILTGSDLTMGPKDQYLGAHAMPVSWVRAIMLVRCNHLLRGHTGVRLEITEAILRLLDLGLTPIVPLRGSISASGDLMPLSYLAGVLEGNPDIKVQWYTQPEPRIVSASAALNIAGIKPFLLGPNEGLGLINGSAASAAVGALAAGEANQLVLLAQVLNGMTCEAMLGNAENYHEFPASVRPHPGQIEVAANIREGLSGSRMAAAKDHFRQGLFQDRYTLRGAPQWLGPVVEDVKLSLDQITTELNSTSDNPVIDSDSGDVYFSCNFQAASVSLAMGKMREGLQMVGKLLFSCTSELISPDLNNGLPSNLAADDPSLSFTMKGVDINMAAYMSELGFLANSVTSHVQSAEMNNQAINSLALISARYTLQAVELVSMMSAAHLYVTCQALDLRVLHTTFLNDLETVVHAALSATLSGLESGESERLQTEVMQVLRTCWKSTSRQDVSVRIEAFSGVLAPILLAHAKRTNSKEVFSMIESIQKHVCEESLALFEATQLRAFSGELNAESSLGTASNAMYAFIRRGLGVPFHCGIWEHPTTDMCGNSGMPVRSRKTIGSWISIIYESIRDGRIRQALQAGSCSSKTARGVNGGDGANDSSGLNGGHHPNGFSDLGENSVPSGSSGLNGGPGPSQDLRE